MSVVIPEELLPAPQIVCLSIPIIYTPSGIFLRAVYHISQEGESCSILYKTDIQVKHKKCSIKTGIGVRPFSELVFEVERNLHQVGYASQK